MDIAQCSLSMLDHEVRKGIEDKARADADTDSFALPYHEGEPVNYAHSLLRSCIAHVYYEAFSKRKARLRRMKDRVRGVSTAASSSSPEEKS